MKTKKSIRFLCVVLSALMILSVWAVVPAFATEPDASEFEYVLNENGQAIITAYNGAGGDIEIPYDIDENEVVGIGANAFVGNEDIYSVKLHDFIESIGKDAFFGCSYLAEVKDMSGNIESFGADAFYGTALYNEDSNWQDGVLYIDCVLVKALESVAGEYTVQNGTITIGDEAFKDCADLTKVNFPDTVKYIGQDAFLNCKHMTEVSVSDAVQVIGSHAFGYFVDDNDDYIRVNDLKIFYESGSAAEQYAESNGFYANEKTTIKSINLTYEEPLIDCMPATKAYISSDPAGALDVSDVDIAYWLMTNTGSIEDAAVPDMNLPFGENMYYMPYITEFFNKAYLTHINSDYTFNANITEITVNGRRIYSDSDMLVKTGVYADKFTITSIKDKTYTGKSIYQSPKVVYNGVKLTLGKDYFVDYENNTNAGTAKIYIWGLGFYGGSTVKTFKINKAKNPMTVKGLAKTVKYKTVKKKNVTVSALTIKKAIGAKAFTKTSGNKKITVNKKTGKLTVKKGLKKGKYTVKIKVTAKGNKNYKPLSKTVKVKITVK